MKIIKLFEIKNLCAILLLINCKGGRRVGTNHILMKKEGIRERAAFLAPVDYDIFMQMESEDITQT
ncbi:hypothetical protein HNO89_002606 [Sporosarcina luteola]|nr:hypothetical protein [Sporosarcina luteola]